MTSVRKESAIQKDITDFLSDLPACKWIKTVTNTKAGHADLIVCLGGKYVEIEVKKPGHKPTPLQAQQLWETYQAGGTALYATSVDEVIDFVANGESPLEVQKWYKDDDVEEVDLT